MLLVECLKYLADGLFCLANSISSITEYYGVWKSKYTNCTGVVNRGSFAVTGHLICGIAIIRIMPRMSLR
jgi:hypothetical protein